MLHVKQRLARAVGCRVSDTVLFVHEGSSHAFLGSSGGGAAGGSGGSAATSPCSSGVGVGVGVRALSTKLSSSSILTSIRQNSSKKSKKSNSNNKNQQDSETHPNGATDGWSWSAQHVHSHQILRDEMSLMCYALPNTAILEFRVVLEETAKKRAAASSRHSFLSVVAADAQATDDHSQNIRKNTEKEREEKHLEESPSKGSVVCTMVR